MVRHRLGGTALAAIGGLLVALAAAMPSWWAGPIHIAGKVIHGKTVHIGLWRASGCNAGDGTCMSLDIGLAFRVVGFAILALAAGTVWASLGLAWSSWRRTLTSGRFARLALIGSVIGVVVALGYIAMLPGRFEEIPAGVSAYGYFVGVVVVVLASLLTLRERSTAQAAPEPMDVRELLSTDMLRPAMLGPEPKLGRYGAVVSDERSTTAPVGPRFRPLYEVEGYQMGGPAPSTGGYAPSTGGYAPSTGGYAPSTGGYAPSTGGYAPSTGGYAPSTGGYAASTGGYAPSTGGYAPSTGGYAASTEGAPGAAGAGPFVGGFPVVEASLGYPQRVSEQRSSVEADAEAAEAALAELRTDTTDTSDALPPSSAALPRAESSAELLDTASIALITDTGAALAPAGASGSWQVDPPHVAAAAEAPADPGFDQPTMPSQMSMAAMTEAANVASAVASAAASASTAGASDPSRPRVAAELPNDSGVFLRGESAPALSRAQAPLPRVPTATTSASLAALAALSKPAVITMAPMIARKLAPPRAGEITSLEQAPACPHCDEPMGWVEKHRRFYCGACRVYF